MTDLYQTIGTKLWTVFPRHADVFELYAQVYPQYSFCGSHWTVANTTHHFSKWEAPNEVLDEVMDLLQGLKQEAMIKGQLWTHCKITVCAQGGVRFQLAFVDEANSHHGLFLQGISDVTEAELAALGVGVGEWRALCNQFPYPTKSQEVAVQCGPESLFALAVDCAIGQHGTAQNTELAYDYFDRLIKYEQTSLAAYYNWAAMGHEPTVCHRPQY